MHYYLPSRVDAFSVRFVYIPQYHHSMSIKITTDHHIAQYSRICLELMELNEKIAQ